MNYKKIVAGAAALSLALSLTACGGGSEDTTATETTNVKMN